MTYWLKKHFLPACLTLWGFMGMVSPLWAQQEIVPWNGIKDTRVRMWVYRPTPKLSNGRAVVIFPGGSYHHLGINHEGHQVAKEMAAHGYTAFAVRYSTSTYDYSYPDMMEDAQRTLQIVKDYADAFDIDSSAVGVMGFSAGGHLAGWTGTYYADNLLTKWGIHTKTSVRPAFVGMFYPVVSMHDDIVHADSRDNLLTLYHSEGLLQRMSLEDNVHPGMPPVYILCCRDDKVVKPQNSLRYHDSLDCKGVPNKLVIYEKGGHGFGFDKKNPISVTWMADFLIWLDDIFKKSLAN